MAAELSSSHCASSTASRTGAASVSSRSRPASATDSVRWSGSVPDGATRRRAISSACRCGSGRLPNTSGIDMGKEVGQRAKGEALLRAGRPAGQDGETGVRGGGDTGLPDRGLADAGLAFDDEGRERGPPRARKRPTAASSIPRPTTSSGTDVPAFLCVRGPADQLRCDSSIDGREQPRRRYIQMPPDAFRRRRRLGRPPGTSAWNRMHPSFAIARLVSERRSAAGQTGWCGPSAAIS